MKYLCDVNILLALAYQAHVDHVKVSAWFQSVSPVATVFFTCCITELGFMRVSVQAGLEADIASAKTTLLGLKASSRVPFQLLPDALGCEALPKYVKVQSQLTDGHLLELAMKNASKFVTLNKGIPGALLVT